MDKVFLESLGLGQEAVEAVLQRHGAALEKLRFDAMLERTITKAGGRSVKAVTALLDTDSLQKADDPGKAAADAVAALKQENSWLFATVGMPYAPGTGTGAFVAPEPRTLADALKEKFHK